MMRIGEGRSYFDFWYYWVQNIWIYNSLWIKIKSRRISSNSGERNWPNWMRSKILHLSLKVDLDPEIKKRRGKRSKKGNSRSKNRRRKSRKVKKKTQKMTSRISSSKWCTECWVSSHFPHRKTRIIHLHLVRRSSRIVKWGDSTDSTWTEEEVLIVIWTKCDINISLGCYALLRCFLWLTKTYPRDGGFRRRDLMNLFSFCLCTIYKRFSSCIRCFQSPLASIITLYRPWFLCFWRDCL